MKSIRDIFQELPVGQEVVVSGWIRSKREGKNHCFISLNDGSCVDHLQVFWDKEAQNSADLLALLVTGASLKATGVLIASPGKGQTLELRATSLVLLGGCPADYPLQKKKHSFEFLREISHLRARTNTIGAVTRIRSLISFAIHRFFTERGFVYLHTPIITSSDCEGSGEMFQVTTLPLEKLKKGEGVDYSKDFFGGPTFLTVSGQLTGESYATALGRIYTFGPTFRAENSHTQTHLSEFWMIEPEMAFCDLEGCIQIAEDLLRSVISSVLEEGAMDMAFFEKWVAPGLIEKLKKVTDSSKFIQLSYTEAIDRLLKAASSENFQFPVSWGCDLATEHERYLTEKVFKQPIVVTDYPKAIKAFYMKGNEDGKTVRAMDILLPQQGEVIGGSQREDDFDRLKAAIEEKGLDPENYGWYLDLRRYGTVEHSGFGLGLERFVQYITGMSNIRDVIPYPRTPGNCSC